MDRLDRAEAVPGSFRDPSGFLFLRGGSLYRQVNTYYKDDYERLMGSGLYKELAGCGLLIPHEEIGAEALVPGQAYKVIRPEPVPFVSYPYEWCFSQLKDAALATLEIQKAALRFGMSLKDCSAYNIQFTRGKPVLVDTLSFEYYVEGRPWVAYRQFCQHFLAPLALMSRKDIRLSQLLRVYIDGIPLDLASALLPYASRFSFSLLAHIHFHAQAQVRLSAVQAQKPTGRVGRLSFMGLIESLESAVKGLKWQAQGTEWSEYYQDTNYSPDGFQQKKDIISGFLGKIGPKTVWDLGSNVGIFSRIASRSAAFTVSFDIDPAVVEKNYLGCIKEGEENVLPLLLDLANPTPGIGWNNKERMSFFERGPVDMVFALALVHHLAISNNLPFDRIADFFAKICSWLVIEFVPKEDSQVQRILGVRDDIFLEYDQQSFEREFRKHFEIQDSIKIKDSKRTLYLMKKIPV